MSELNIWDKDPIFDNGFNNDLKLDNSNYMAVKHLNLIAANGLKMAPLPIKVIAYEDDDNFGRDLAKFLGQEVFTMMQHVFFKQTNEYIIFIQACKTLGITGYSANAWACSMGMLEAESAANISKFGRVTRFDYRRQVQCLMDRNFSERGEIGINF
jgi:hypothetical protein